MNAALPTTPAAGSFAAAVEWHGRIALVRVRGALDWFATDEARRVLLDVLDSEPRRLVVDVADAFVDSAGIGVLVHIAQRARQERREYRLRCHRQLAAILRMHALSELLGVDVPTEATAKSDHRERGGRLAA